MDSLLEDVSGEEQRMGLTSIEMKFLQHLHIKGALYLNAHCCCRLKCEDESIHRLVFVIEVCFVSITVCEGSPRAWAFSFLFPVCNMVPGVDALDCLLVF